MKFSEIEVKKQWLIYQKADHNPALREIDSLRAVTTKRGKGSPNNGDVVWLWGKVSKVPGRDYRLRSCFVAGKKTGDVITADNNMGVLFSDMPLLDQLNWFQQLKDMQPWARGPILLNLRHESADIAETYSAIQKGLIDLLEQHPDYNATGSSENEVLEDQSAIQNDADLTLTEKDQLISARVGQGAFRKELLSLWGGYCAATLSPEQAMITASHVVPWRLCETNEQRLDPANGIPLCASLDKLFDQGLITFKRAGIGRDFYLRASSQLNNPMKALSDAGLTNGKKPQDYGIHFPAKGPTLDRFAKHMAVHNGEIFKL